MVPDTALAAEIEAILLRSFPRLRPGEAACDADHRTAAAEIAALRSFGDGRRRMETELRTDHQPDRTHLDEVVVKGCTAFHAEMMSGTSLWIGLSDAAGGLLHVWIEASRKGGTVLRMTAEDRGEPTITRGAAFTGLPLPVRTGGEP